MRCKKAMYDEKSVAAKANLLVWLRWSGCSHDEDTVVRIEQFGLNLCVHFWCKTPDTLVNTNVFGDQVLIGPFIYATRMRTWCGFFWKETAVNDYMISSDGNFLSSFRFNSQMGPLFLFFCIYRGHLRVFSF